MICEKCGKLNAGKNTVCSSCNAPLPGAKSCGGFEDILTVNVPVPEATSTQATISSVSSARTEAAINKLSASNEELKKKNSTLMMFSFCAAGLALIAIIIAIVAAVSPSVSPAEFSALESEVVSLNDDIDALDDKSYDAVENDMVYTFLSDYITVDLNASFNAAIDANLSEEADYTAFDELEAYLKSSYNKLGNNGVLLANSLNTVFAEKSSEDFEKWLEEKYPTIYEIYTESDDYKETVVVNHFNELYENYLKKAEDINNFSIENNTKDDFKNLCSEYNKAKTELEEYYNNAENKAILEKNQILSVFLDETAESKVDELDYYFKGNFTITFNIPNSKPAGYKLANNDMFVIEETEANKNVLPKDDVLKTSDDEKFVGWSAVKDPESTEFCYTNEQLTEKNAYEFFKELDIDKDKNIELYPIFAKADGYTVIFLDEEGNPLKKVKKDLPFYILKEEDYVGVEENDSYNDDDINKTFSGYVKKSDENITLNKEDFVGKSIASVEGEYTQTFEDHKIIYFKDEKGKTIISYDNIGTEKLTEEVINKISEELPKGDNVVISDKNKNVINLVDFKDKSVAEITDPENDGTTSITFIVTINIPDIVVEYFNTRNE